MFNLRAMSVAAFIWALALSPAGAITILSSQSAGSIPGASGTGLSGSFYSFAAFTSSISSLAQADSLIAAHPTPTATFTATTPCVQTCGASVNDSLTVLQFRYVERKVHY